MSEVIQRSTEEVQAIAASMGLVCMLPDSTEIQLDFDSEVDASAKVIAVLAQNGWSVVSTLSTKSKGGNTHLYIKLDVTLGPLQRICLQACLGSDPVREVLSMIRLNGGSNAPTALFETPAQALRVNAWRKKHGDIFTMGAA